MCADWRGIGCSISELLYNLHKEPSAVRDSFTDVTILLPDKTRVRAHKFILVLASPRFEAHFCGLWAEDAETFTVRDVSSKTFRHFLDFIYNSGKVDDYDISDCWSLLEAGHLYIHKGLIKHCTEKLSQYIRKLEASEEMVDCINKAIKLSIYDELVDVATKSILQKFPHYFQDGLLDNLNQTSLDSIKTRLATSSWVGDARNCLYIQHSLVLEYNHLSHHFGDVINECKKKLLIYLQSKSSKKDFIKRIKSYACDFVNSDGDGLDAEVMRRLKNRLQSQSWEELCDNGNGFLNNIEFLMGEVEGLFCFAEDEGFSLMEFDDEDALDWHAGNARFTDENSWWDLLLYSRSANLTNVKEYCKKILYVCILKAYTNLNNLILHMNRSSEFSEDKDLFKLAIFMFLVPWCWDYENNQKENWVTLNEGAIIGIRDNFEEFSHIKNEEVRDNIHHWCKENSRTESEAEERFLHILGPGLI